MDVTNQYEAAEKGGFSGYVILSEAKNEIDSTSSAASIYSVFKERLPAGCGKSPRTVMLSFSEASQTHNNTEILRFAQNDTDGKSPFFSNLPRQDF